MMSAQCSLPSSSPPSGSAGWFSGWFGYFFSPPKRFSLAEHSSSPPAHSFPTLVDANLDDWEWVLSRTEEFLLKQSENEIARTLSELSELRGVASYFKLKPVFLRRATDVMLSLRPEDRAELQNPLDSSKRSKVITDVVRQYADEWKEWIRKRFFEKNIMAQQYDKWNKFSVSYCEQTYSKNTIGILREVGWQASHGIDGTLSAKVLCDITWSIWNALRGAIRSAIEFDIPQDDLLALAEAVSKMEFDLTQLWLATIRTSKGGTQREGLVVTGWIAEEKIEQQRILDMKSLGQVDERYEGGRIEIHDWERKKAGEVRKIKNSLQQTLTLHSPTHKQQR